MKANASLLLPLLAVFAPTAGFAAAPTVAAGDLLVGFRVAGLQGAGTCYVLNIGSAAGYRDATSARTIGPAGSTVVVGDINADLSNLFGANWATRTDLSWGAAASPNINGPFGSDPEDTMYFTQVQNTEGVQGSNISITSATNRGTVAGRIFNMIGIGIQGGFDNEASTATQAPDPGYSAFAAFQPESNANSWRSFMAPSGVNAANNLDFGGFSNIEALPTKTLSLLRMSDSNAAAYLGYLKIESNGTLTFTPKSSMDYNSWASTHVNGQAANLDFDGDGVSNGAEFFMGSPNGFTVNPAVSSGSVTWSRASGITVTAFNVQTSTDLVTWTNATSGVTVDAASVKYTPPTGQSKVFVRLSVTP